VTLPSVAGELESGTAPAVLSRPVSRLHFLVGKWVGLVVLIAAYVSVASAGEFLVVRAVTGYLPPHPVMFVAFMVAEAVVILTLAMLVSTRIAPIAGGVLVLGAFMLAWLGGVAVSLGREFGVQALVTGGTVTRLLLPTDGMWKGAVYALEPVALLATAQADDIGNFPFFSQAPPSVPYMLWTAAWVAGILALSVRSLRRREI
jgi:ABC-type transport system involved in multi-copper enzyme maturation permease subunit